ncbi:MAG: cytochrome c oxidase subunit 3 [Candidatus Acidiferrales bacterium]
MASRSEAEFFGNTLELESEKQSPATGGGVPPGAVVHPGGGPGTVTAPRPERSETGVWIGVAAISMTFAAFTSAMIVREGASTDWQHFQLPRILYLNTLILLASSFTLQAARARLGSVSASLSGAPALARKLFSDGIHWLYVTAGLGALFVLGQILAWRDLVHQGLFLATNPSCSFFYVFTALHGLHLLGGIGGLAYILRKLAKTNGTAQTTGLSAVSVYWHFMDGLWVYLLLLLAMRM